MELNLRILHVNDALEAKVWERVDDGKLILVCDGRSKCWYNKFEWTCHIVVPSIACLFHLFVDLLVCLSISPEFVDVSDLIALVGSSYKCGWRYLLDQDGSFDELLCLFCGIKLDFEKRVLLANISEMLIDNFLLLTSNLYSSLLYFTLTFSNFASDKNSGSLNSSWDYNRRVSNLMQSTDLGLFTWANWIKKVGIM